MMSWSLVGLPVPQEKLRHVPKQVHTLLWHTQHAGAGSPLWTRADRAVPGWTLAITVYMIFSIIFRHLECNLLQLKPLPRWADR